MRSVTGCITLRFSTTVPGSTSTETMLSSSVVTVSCMLNELRDLATAMKRSVFILFFETNVSDSPETTTNAFIRGCAGMYPPAEGSCARAALRMVVAVVVCLEQCVRWSVRKRAKSLGVL